MTGVMVRTAGTYYGKCLNKCDARRAGARPVDLFAQKSGELCILEGNRWALIKTTTVS